MNLYDNPQREYQEDIALLEKQAEQCTILIHYKGKCTVKTGSMELLKPMHEKLISRGLTSEIV